MKIIKENRITQNRIKENRKTCGRCGETKALNEFHRNQNGGATLDNLCKACRGTQRVITAMTLDKRIAYGS